MTLQALGEREGARRIYEELLDRLVLQQNPQDGSTRITSEEVFFGGQRLYWYEQGR